MATEKRGRKHPKTDIYAKERESGKSVTEIAKIYGVSYQAVAQAVAKRGIGHFKHYTEENCIYPNFRKWLNDNKVTRSEFSRRIGIPPSATNNRRISQYFIGCTDPRKSTVDKMLEITGMTYEELFKEDK